MNLKPTRKAVLATIATIAIVAMLIALPVVVISCSELLRSDNANFAHRNAQANDEARANNEIASKQAAAALAVSGDALARMLAGKSHINEYRKSATDAKPYFTTYHYFSPDGQYVSRDTYSRRSVEFQTVGRWSVIENVLCVNEQSETDTAQCFTLKVTDGGVIQYWIHKPSDASHGLLTSTVEIVRPGLQTPEYVTTESPNLR